MARVKTVFGSHANTAHVWAQQTYDVGRSGDGRMIFEGRTMFSYRHSYPIACFTDGRLDGQQVVLINSDRYSVSTGAHIRECEGALRGLPVVTIHVPAVRIEGEWTAEQAHAANVLHFVNRFEEAAAQFAKPHAQTWRGDAEKHISDLSGYIASLQDYCRAFGLPVPDVGRAAREQAIRDAFARYNDPKAVAKRERAAGRRQLKYAAALSRFHGWLEGVCELPPLASLPKAERRQAQNVIWAKEREQNKREEITPEQWQEGKGQAGQPYYWHDDTLVRRKGERLETSRGAVVPWPHAVAVFVRAQRCIMTGKDWHANGDRIQVGTFHLDAIDANGNIRAGCHTIEFAEMLRLARLECPELVRFSYPLPAKLED